MIYAKFKNDRTMDNGYTGSTEMEKNIFYFQEGFPQSVFRCCVTIAPELAAASLEAGTLHN